MPKIGVYTDDFMFYHKVIQLLRKWNLPFVNVSSDSTVTDDVKVILSSNSDRDIWPAQVKGAEPINALRKGLSRILDRYQFSKLTVGVDPGPRPGIAVIGDNVLLEAFEITDPAKSSSHVGKILSDYPYRESAVRIGHGDLPNRIIIEEALRKSGIESVVVDESNTSYPHNLHNNALSAARIARDSDYFHGTPDLTGLKRKEFVEKEFVTIRRFLA